MAIAKRQLMEYLDQRLNKECKSCVTVMGICSVVLQMGVDRVRKYVLWWNYRMHLDDKDENGKPKDLMTKDRPHLAPLCYHLVCKNNCTKHEGMHVQGTTHRDVDGNIIYYPMFATPNGHYTLECKGCGLPCEWRPVDAYVSCPFSAENQPRPGETARWLCQSWMSEEVLDEVAIYNLCQKDWQFDHNTWYVPAEAWHLFGDELLMDVIARGGKVRWLYK
uniref:Uncharacterized protein n=1 Tax=viral metagenome TaxID=1070528 RepID=A0A2V0RJL5_9ZZZZ